MKERRKVEPKRRVKTSKNGHKADRLLSYKEPKPPPPPPSKELSSRATKDIPVFRRV